MKDLPKETKDYAKNIINVEPFGRLIKVCWVCGDDFYPSRYNQTRCSNCQGKKIKGNVTGYFYIWIKAKMRIKATTFDEAIARANIKIQSLDFPMLEEIEVLQPQKKHIHYE